MSLTLFLRIPPIITCGWYTGWHDLMFANEIVNKKYLNYSN
tara:strand:+ start:225 stop:347 length:123 start_codon:yes stop_codon:yes gene_type:complete